MATAPTSPGSPARPATTGSRSSRSGSAVRSTRPRRTSATRRSSAGSTPPWLMGERRDQHELRRGRAKHPASGDPVRLGQWRDPGCLRDNSPTPLMSSNYPAQYIQPEGTGPNIDAGMAWWSPLRSIPGSGRHSRRGLTASPSRRVRLRKRPGQRRPAGSSTWPPPRVSLDSAGVRTTVIGDNRYAYLVGTSMATLRSRDWLRCSGRSSPGSLRRS